MASLRSDLRNTSDDMLQFYSKQEYLSDITRRIQHAVAGDEVTLMSMTLDPDDRMITALLDALCDAAKCGVEVRLLIDANTFLVQAVNNVAVAGPLFWYRDLSPEIYAVHPVLLALCKLKDNGGHYTILNQPGRPFTNPFGSRCHIKLCLINDRVYLGGCNLDRYSEIDMMIGWDDAETAQYLRNLALQFAESGRTYEVMAGQDIERKLTAAAAAGHETTLYIDSGKRRQSIIYDRALALIGEAKESVYITCQYFPNHITARHLKAAQKRGVKVTILYNNPDKDVWPFTLVHHVVVRLERLRRPYDFFHRELPKGTDFLHAKLIATESAAMIGSHNYVRAGVNFGTAEIALLRYDPTFAKIAIATIEAQLT